MFMKGHCALRIKRGIKITEMILLSPGAEQFSAYPCTEPAVVNDGNLENEVPSKSTFHEGHFSGTKYELQSKTWQ